MSGTLRSEAMSPPKQPGPMACQQCRKVKMKCCPREGSTSCDRCARLHMECIFSAPKKRGRKRTRPRLESHDSPRQIEPKGPSLSGAPATSSVTEAMPADTLASTPSNSAIQDGEDDVASEFWSEAKGLQPSTLLNRESSKRKFSLQHILSTNRSPRRSQMEMDGDITNHQEDPVVAGIVAENIASTLFDSFMKNFNPFICVLDHILYTYEYVRGRSTFLLTVILAAAAKTFNSALHEELNKHSEALLLKAFSRGPKSAETIQAILLKTYWKQPEDTRSWPIMGYVIRLCMEQGWHKLTLVSPEEDAKQSAVASRQRRNVERMWLILFVYDRSMSLQTGKPWMIDRSDFIESVCEWRKHPQAIANDKTLAAMVTLRLAGGNVLEIFTPQRPTAGPVNSSRSDSLLKALTAQIEAWKKHWLEPGSDEGKCHSFLVSFFGSHLLLLLYSFPLENSISSPSGVSFLDMEAFSVTYSCATEMLRLVSQVSMVPMLQYAHDSVHAMTAYAAVFLIKLLLSVTQGIQKEFERAAIEAIEGAARVFAQQGGPPQFTCALQAKFLNNVVQEYYGVCRRRIPRSTSNQRTPTSTTLPYADVAPLPLPVVDVPMASSDAVYDRPPMLQRAATTAKREPIFSSNFYTRAGGTTVAQSSPDIVPRLNLARPPTNGTSYSGSYAQSQGSPPQGPSPSSWTQDPTYPQNAPLNQHFTDQDWAALFMNAGFDIGDGVFVRYGDR